MTANLINYWRHQEDRRSHIANEEETHRSNLAREIETNRYNTAVLIETSRHNFEMEDAARRQASASMISASASYLNAQTQVKKQAEEVRHNQALEEIQEANSWYQANLRGMELDETIRTNTVREEETERHNREMEQAALAGNLVGSGFRVLGTLKSSFTKLFYS